MLNEKGIGDIMYIYMLRYGWCHLASAMNLHTQNCKSFFWSQNDNWISYTNIIQCL